MLLTLRTRYTTRCINMLNISGKLLHTEYLLLVVYHRLYQIKQPVALKTNLELVKLRL